MRGSVVAIANSPPRMVCGSALEAEAERGQRFQVGRREAPVAQGRAATCAAFGRRPPRRAWRAREARRRRRLIDAIELDRSAARGDLRMADRLREGQHRREAGIRTFEYRAP